MAAADVVDILRLNVLTGSGAPTGIVAPAGSIYINTTGTTSATHLYINCGSTVNAPSCSWTPITTVAT